MFIFHDNTKILCPIKTKPVQHAVAMLRRDMKKILRPTSLPETQIICRQGCDFAHESYRITVSDTIEIVAGDNLGFVYALLYLSEHYLGVKPFWFWMDQPLAKINNVEIPPRIIHSPTPRIKYRGWFFNDEVLLMKWRINGDSVEPWRMAFEALLRCGGNATIPGTDKSFRQNRQLAADMGLWITHHHAEPLGAEMFVRAYPNESPDYGKNAALFHALWEKSVQEQKNYNIIWNLCFRGQGDCAFWDSDTSGMYNTPEKRGALITQIIALQCDFVRKHIQNPVFCTNLYGEIMELYEQGHIQIAPEVIKVRADNGYGKMVTRRRDNHPGRTCSMPDAKDSGSQGIYYHVSFYDLQAANHITMLPNSVEFVNRELEQVLKNGGDDFWMINCSNVRPHVYYLDAIRKIWQGKSVTDAIHSEQFAEDYYVQSDAVAACYATFPMAMPAFGTHEDEHAGEQFYTENVRILAHQLLVHSLKGATQLQWLAGDVSLQEQAQVLRSICVNSLERLQALAQMCEQASAKLQAEEKLLFDSTIFLQVKLHCFGAQGTILFADGLDACISGDYPEAFVLLGDSAQQFAAAYSALRSAEYDVWEGFYTNDCMADYKHTAYLAKKAMGIVREFGDNIRHDQWYRDYVLAPEDAKVFLLLVTDNHMEDEALYYAMKKVRKNHECGVDFNKK